MKSSVSDKSTVKMSAMVEANIRTVLKTELSISEIPSPTQEALSLAEDLQGKKIHDIKVLLC